MTDMILTDDEMVAFDSRDHAAQITSELIDLARQEICIFGPIIDPVLFDNEVTIAKLSEFARRSQRTRLRIVVHDTRKNVIDSHRLLPLAQRLTSHIQIHITHQKHQDQRHQFMLIDGKAYLYCPNAERYQGRAEKDAAGTVRDFQQQFEELWSHSRPDVNTRRLNI